MYCLIIGLSSFTYTFFSIFFFFNDTATTEIYTLSLHDALPISACPPAGPPRWPAPSRRGRRCRCLGRGGDRKSTRLNSSHVEISYAVFCLKKKKKKMIPTPNPQQQKKKLEK